MNCFKMAHDLYLYFICPLYLYSGNPTKQKVFVFETECFVTLNFVFSGPYNGLLWHHRLLHVCAVKQEGASPTLSLCPGAFPLQHLFVFKLSNTVPLLWELLWQYHIFRSNTLTAFFPTNQKVNKNTLYFNFLRVWKEKVEKKLITPVVKSPWANLYTLYALCVCMCVCVIPSVKHAIL